ncbi:uncharacterized protein LOC132601424 [Lycium barbarum]|uniref:uncharacterized protein LOC132601424 n=1 Tax=Lycium barbarum TaxID=112863 RepID=UPI00293E21F0|nr:uncharacterized protein LOC132601424 [Lycium barbarum]
MEKMMKKMMGVMQKIMVDQQKLIADNQNHDLAVRNLERQMGQIASAQSTRLQGGLPSDTDPNLKPCTAVSLRNRSGLQGIPKYAKYIKDIVASKSHFTEYTTVALTEECTCHIQNKLPIKLKDPSSFTIEITIGKQVIARALCDLGASINLMPSSMFRNLGLGNSRPTTIVLQVAHRSLARPEGIIEDVLVQVRKSVDRCNGRAAYYEVHDKVEVFNLYKAIKLPAFYEELSAITMVNDDTRRPLITSHDPLERAVVGEDVFGDTEAVEMMQILDLAGIYFREGDFEPLDRKIGPPSKLSIEEAPKLEFNPLPTHLKYALLGKGETLPVILAA